MKVVVYVAATIIYFAVLLYLLVGVLGFFNIGVRIAGNMFADEGFFFQRPTNLILLVLLLCGGFYAVWRINRRSA